MKYNKIIGILILLKAMSISSMDEDKALQQAIEDTLRAAQEEELKRLAEEQKKKLSELEPSEEQIQQIIADSIKTAHKTQNVAGKDDIQAAIDLSLNTKADEDSLIAIALSLKDSETKSRAEDVNKKQVKPEDICAICTSKASELPKDAILNTKCCNQLICQRDLDELKKVATELWNNLQNPVWRTQYAAHPDFGGWPQPKGPNAECPFCRNYPLQTDKVGVL